MTELFQKNTTANIHLFLLIILSLIMMTADRHGRYVPTIRSYLSVTVTPFYYIVHFPLDVFYELSGAMDSYETLLAKNKVLESKNLKLDFQLKKFNTIKAENKRLRVLFAVKPNSNQRVEIVKIMLSDLDPFQQQIMIDKGYKNDIEIGLPLFDELGVIGQVIDVSRTSSRVMMITDREHTLPVVIQSSGFLTIAKGVGSGKLSLLYMHSNSSEVIVVGDKVLTSGRGGRFPAGYPVGEVVLIRSEEGLPYAHAQVKVSSKLNANRIALVAWKDIDQQQTINPRNISPTIDETVIPKH